MSHDHQWVLVPAVFPQNCHTDWAPAEHLHGIAPGWWCGGLLVPGLSAPALPWTFPSPPCPFAGPRCPGTETTSSTARSPAQRYCIEGFLACQKIPAPSPARAEGSLQHRVLGLAERSVRLAAGRHRGGSKGRGGHVGTVRGTGQGLCWPVVQAPDVFSAQCFAVRSLGWVEIPEEDLAPGKSSIAVNNCIQQLSNSKCQGQGSADNWGEVRAWGGAQSRYRVPSVPGDQCCWGWLSSHRGSGEPRELCRWQSQL